jgi:AraC-like DNA-binding protein
MTALLLLDTATRGAAGGIVLVMGLAIGRDGRNRLAARLTALLCLTIIGHLVTVAPASPRATAWWDFPFEVLSISVPPMFWLVAMAVFVDDYRLRPLHLAIAGAHAAFGALFIFVLFYDDALRAPAGALLRVGMFGFVIAALVVAWRGRADDLVEDRRRLRDLLIWSIGILALVIPTMEVAQHAGLIPPETVTLSAAVILIISIINAWFLIGLRDEDLLRRAAAVEAVPLSADPDEPRLLAALGQLMNEERVYRSDIGIAEVAARVGVPEYRLRRLINQRLGHRNFAAYLNGFRLAEVKAALADPAQRDVPILTIALDAGFGSLAPFNRAFRDAEGMTPSDYRERARNGGNPRTG